ncbi:hypothetical protein V6N12_061008 [Hibiscus sabdariffa]|uniref:Uncharacterized protein n=1 Tax=Hibiscus sabdariffa TaxID=183260 RepID=A0ABR2DVS7_9ROSI
MEKIKLDLRVLAQTECSRSKIERLKWWSCLIKNQISTLIFLVSRQLSECFEKRVTTGNLESDGPSSS